MNAETRPENLQGYIPPELTEKAAEMTQYVGRRLTEKVIAYTTVNLPKGFTYEYSKNIIEGYLPIIVANHASHADGASISKLTRYLTKRAYLELHPDQQDFNGFNLPLAKSLLTGHQGWKLRRFYKYAEPAIEANGLFALPLVRDKDKEKYGLETNPKEYLRTLRNRVEDGYGGLVLFPEGTTISGQKDESGRFLGIQPFEEDSISAHIRLLKKYSRKNVMIIPGGISGGHEVINSGTKSIPFKAFTKAMRPDMFTINVGDVIKTDDPNFSALLSSEEINDFVGNKIAALLPPEMRGIYASTA